MTLLTALPHCAAGLALLLWSLPAPAGDLDVVINGRSHHINSRYDWNENNLGLGLEYQFSRSSRWIWTVNANSFLDSQDDLSYMGGAGLKRRLVAADRFGGFYLDAGIVAFLMSRADINERRPFPGLLPTMTLGNRHAGVNITFVPKKALHDVAGAQLMDPTLGGVIFLQLKIDFGLFVP